MKAPPVLVTGVAGYAGGGWVAVLPPRGIRAQGTGEALRESGVPLTGLRAGVVVRAGSPSFEMNRWLTERFR